MGQNYYFEGYPWNFNQILEYAKNKQLQPPPPHINVQILLTCIANPQRLKLVRQRADGVLPVDSGYTGGRWKPAAAARSSYFKHCRYGSFYT